MDPGPKSVQRNYVIIRDKHSRFTARYRYRQTFLRKSLKTQAKSK